MIIFVPIAGFVICVAFVIVGYHYYFEDIGDRIRSMKVYGTAMMMMANGVIFGAMFLVIIWAKYNPTVIHVRLN